MNSLDNWAAQSPQYETIGLCVAYAVLMIGLGLFFNKRAQASTSGFYSADANVGWFVNSFAVLATVMSGGGMMGNVGVASSLGVLYICAGNFACGPAVGLAGLYVAGPLRKSRSRTLSDFFQKRFESRAITILCVAILSIAYTGYMVAQMKASGTVGEYLLGTGFIPTMVVTWVIFTAYTILGGMLAVTYNDFIQGLIMTAVAVMIGMTALIGYGFDYSALMAAATEAYPNMGLFHMPIWSYIGFFFIWFLVNQLAPSVCMRAASAKNPFSAGIGLNLAFFWLAVFTFFQMMVSGPAARALVGTEGLVNNDAYLLVLVNTQFGVFMKGLLGAAVFSAIMSTMAGVLLAVSASIANDVICKIWTFSDKKQAKVGVITVLVVACIVLAFSFNPPDLLALMYSKFMALMVCGLWAPLIFGIWWKRMTAKGALWGMLAGSISYGLLFFGLTMPDFSELFFAIPISILFIVIGSLTSPPPSAEKVRELESWHEKFDVEADVILGKEG
ncbi:MAG: sodium:solute symporter family protein [Anaerovoracaceae bacterium]|nr:sodium:solute symporter family protein [Anaerovoracaceae bacterium]